MNVPYRDPETWQAIAPLFDEVAAVGEHPGPGGNDPQGRIPPGLLCGQDLAVHGKHAPEFASCQEPPGGSLNIFNSNEALNWLVCTCEYIPYRPFAFPYLI
jgi:hypothetical protein